MAESYVFDTTTGTWVPASSSTGSSAPSQDPENVPTSDTGNDSTSEVDSKTEADKEYIETEFNTLTGEIVVNPSSKNVKIKVNNTVELVGVGSNLSGKYFVSAVKRTLNKDSGYEQTLTVMKNGFGDSLKGESEEPSSRSAQVTKSSYQVRVGDTVKVVGSNAIFITGETVPLWVKERTLTVEQISVDGSRVLLMPISNWTYAKYVQKA